MGVENEPRVPAGSPEGGQWTGGPLNIEVGPVGKYKPLATVGSPQEAKDWIDKNADWKYAGTGGQFKKAVHKTSRQEIVITAPKTPGQIAADRAQFGGGKTVAEHPVSYDLTHRVVPGARPFDN